MRVTSRRHACGQSRAILRLEGLHPSADTDALLDAWSNGDLSDDDLLEIARRLAAGEQPAQLREQFAAQAA